MRKETIIKRQSIGLMKKPKRDWKAPTNEKSDKRQNEREIKREKVHHLFDFFIARIHVESVTETALQKQLLHTRQHKTTR
jgi:hypothetical protein